VSQNRPPLVAPVGGFAAFVLARVLEDALPSRLVGLQRQVESGNLHPDFLAQVTQAWAAIQEASRQYKQAAASASESAEEVLAEVPAASGEIDTDRAAGLLRVTPSRVRQLVRSGDLPGRKLGREWLVDRTAIDLRLEANSRGHFR
jgi:excisionase family DNA binding protein